MTEAGGGDDGTGGGAVCTFGGATGSSNPGNAGGNGGTGGAGVISVSNKLVASCALPTERNGLEPNGSEKGSKSAAEPSTADLKISLCWLSDT